jgi:hypothetical protein
MPVAADLLHHRGDGAQEGGHLTDLQRLDGQRLAADDQFDRLAG